MPSILIILYFVTVLSQSYGNPINSNHHDVNETINSDFSSRFFCSRNSSSSMNISLFEFFNENRFWIVVARTTFVYGPQTWNNVLIQTSTNNNGTIALQFLGENNNQTCVSSEMGFIQSNTTADEVKIHWSEREGFLKIISMDEKKLHLFICYTFDANQLDHCPQNQSEHMVIHNEQEEIGNDTFTWLQSHCSNINSDHFIFNVDPKTCLPIILKSDPADFNHTEEIHSNMTETVPSSIPIEQENVTNGSIVEIHSSPIHSINVTEVVEINSTNVDKSDQLSNTTTTMIMEIITTAVLSANDSSIEETNQINATIVEHIDVVTNETVGDEVHPLVVHKAEVMDTTTAFVNDVTEVNNYTTPVVESSPQTIHSASAISLVNESFTVQPVPPTTESLPITTENHSTTVITTTIYTTTYPSDCPVPKDCPVTNCTFGHKVDYRGCPTCNCLLPVDRFDVTCPSLTCAPCLYGHYSDSNGCATCQCQPRPYPPLGERCPQLNCDPCYFGTVKDEYNCDSCICIRPNIQECPVLNCTFGPCKYGSISDEDNCPSCDCLLPSTNTTELNCTLSTSCPPCHLGYITDADGCQTCQCKQRSSVSCSSVASICNCPYGSYLDPNGCETCSCLPDPTNISRRACWELKKEAISSDPSSGPTCAPDGFFSARQCDQTKCWCVTPLGIEIHGFQSIPEENANCACAVELYQVSSLHMIGHHLSCVSNGNYAPIQCDERYCSCVDEFGKPIGPSVSIQNRDHLRCVGVYQQLHPERFVLHQGTIEHPDFSHLSHSSLCLSHLEQVRNTNITDGHFLIPICDGNGLYASVQCDRTERYCWCVDKKTGVEIDGTRRLNARPNCNLVS